MSVLLLPLIFFALLIRSLFAEPFNAPSASMAPTLVVGDYFLVDKTAYGYSRYSLPLSLPLFPGRIFAREPARGDVVVFALPKDPSVSYIKRIVGLPGDRIQLKNARLYINDALVPRRPAGDYAYREYDADTHLHRYIETLPGMPEVEHAILQVSDDGPLADTPVYVVPPGHYFAVGDNRDNSQDSRILSAVGYIPEENLIGRASFIFDSREGGRVFKEIR